MLLLLLFTGKSVVLMLRARFLKAIRERAKAAAKAAKAAAEAAANSDSPDVIATNATTAPTEVPAPSGPEVDVLTFGHQRLMAAVATLIQVLFTMTSPFWQW